MAKVSAQMTAPSFGMTKARFLLSLCAKEASPDHMVPIQASSAMNFCLIVSVS